MQDLEGRMQEAGGTEAMRHEAGVTGARRHGLQRQAGRRQGLLEQEGRRCRSYLAFRSERGGSKHELYLVQEAGVTGSRRQCVQLFHFQMYWLHKKIVNIEVEGRTFQDICAR